MPEESSPNTYIIPMSLYREAITSSEQVTVRARSQRRPRPTIQRGAQSGSLTFHLEAPDVPFALPEECPAEPMNRGNEEEGVPEYRYTAVYEGRRGLDPFTTGAANTLDEIISKASEDCWLIEIHDHSGGRTFCYRRCPVCKALFQQYGYSSLCPICEPKYTLCRGCREFFLNEKLTDVDGYPLCDGCVGNYSVCDGCRGLFPDDTLTDYEGDTLCHNCIDDREPDEEEEGLMHDYGYKPRPHFLPSREPDTLYLGVELEVDRFKEYEGRDYALEALGDIDPPQFYFYCKSDGSLSNGIEVVSHPATLDYHRKAFPWEAIVEAVRKYGGKSHNTASCGLHIHFNVDFLGQTADDRDMETLKLLYLFEKFWDKIVPLSRRTPSELDSYSRRYVSSSRWMTLAKTKELKRGAGRNYAVNLENHHTIEIRLFKGTLHLPSLLATLEFVDFLVKLVKEKPIERCHRLTWVGLLKAIDVQRYPNLVTYINERRDGNSVPNNS